MAQARVTGAEVVERDVQARPAKLGKRAHRLVDAQHHRAFGELDLEVLRFEPARRERGAHSRNQILVVELPRRDVDGDRNVRQPGVSPRDILRARRLDHPFTDLDDETALLGDRKCLRRGIRKKGSMG